MEYFGYKPKTIQTDNGTEFSYNQAKIKKEHPMDTLLKELKINLYGVNCDETMECNEFTYMICENYKEGMKIPEKCVVKEIPKFTWAIFPCHGPAFKSMPELNEKIFKEWLHNSNDFEIAGGYNIEMYTDPSEYRNGIMDEKYYTEVWIPIKKK